MTSHREAVRKRPGMYVGDVDGFGRTHLVLEVVGNAFDQHLAGRCRAVDVQIEADGTVIVTDDGPGLRAAGRGAVPPLAVILEQWTGQPTRDGHRPHVHLGLTGVGLYAVNALSDRFEVVTVCDGEEARALYSRGVAVEPIATRASDQPDGTRVTFRPDAEIFARARLDAARLVARLDELAFLAAGLAVSWTIAGGAAGRACWAGGIVDWVARETPERLGGVAYHRETYATEHGPVEVSVALAWRAGALAAPAPGVIHSFVNLDRSRDHGTHVQGLRRGLRAVVSEGRRGAERDAGVVAVVSVVLADVLFGNPTRDKLVSGHAVGPCERATRAALGVWVEAWPEAAGMLRERR